MAIRLTLNKTEKPLFCESKWWGDPDMSPDMEYPMMRVCEHSDGTSEILKAGQEPSDGEVYEYPLTFICQIRCEDLIPFDTENKLPHDGMLYFSRQWMSIRGMIRLSIWAWANGRRALS